MDHGIRFASWVVSDRAKENVTRLDHMGLAVLVVSGNPLKVLCTWK